MGGGWLGGGGEDPGQPGEASLSARHASGMSGDTGSARNGVTVGRCRRGLARLDRASPTPVAGFPR